MSIYKLYVYVVFIDFFLSKIKPTYSRYPWDDTKHRPNYFQDFHCPQIFSVWRLLELSEKKIDNNSLV